jgi:hypothetical protein
VLDRLWQDLAVARLRVRRGVCTFDASARDANERPDAVCRLTG